MELERVVKIAFIVNPIVQEILESATDYYEKMIEVLSEKSFVGGRLLLALKLFLDKQTEKFDGTLLVAFHRKSSYEIHPFSELVNKTVNQSSFDILANQKRITNLGSEMVDFIYPYRLSSYTFLTSKPEYKPHIFGIFQTFSSTVWMTLALVLTAMFFLYCIVFNRKSTSLSRIFLHVFAVLMKQSALIIPSSYFENIIVYSWIFAAMFLCLAHDSVFLSFLSFPPVTIIKDVPSLAAAVKNGNFHCIANTEVDLVSTFLKSNNEHLQVIGSDLRTNNLSTNTFVKFISNNKGNLALFDHVMKIHFYGGKFFISEERLIEWMPGMIVSKQFCCKNLLDTFVHRMMASGIYFKYLSDAEFLIPLKLNFYPLESDTKRKLTLTDVAPAFIFLLCGYFISFLVFIIEISIKRKKKY